MIDWSREIETVDGKPLVYLPERNTGENDFPRWVESPDNSYITRFYSDCGKPWNPRNPDLRNVAQPAVFPTPDERAVAPELVERMRKLVETLAVYNWLDNPITAIVSEARAIVAALEPVDPDVAEADAIMAMDEYKGGNNHVQRAVIAAIKRGRQLQRDSVTGVTLGTREQFEKECG